MEPGRKLNQMETFSLVYLARYPGDVIPARVVQSFQRAWGLNSVTRRPYIDGGRPGYTLAIFPDDPIVTPSGTYRFNRMTVAIEGMRSVSQLRTFWGSYNTSTYGTFPGRVLAAYAAHAETIYTELMATPAFVTELNKPNCGITFAGFSLGAAVAEVLFAKFGALNPLKFVQLSKWASPRVGNAAWANGAHLRPLRGSYYITDDPIHLFPYATLANMSTRAFDWAPTHTIFAPNTPSIVYNLDSSRNMAELSDGMLAHVRATIAGQGALTPANVWYYHNADAYRLMLMNSAEQPGSDSAEGFYRFQALEYDGDNGWQVNFRAGQEDYAGLTQIYDPPPGDRPVTYEPAADAMRVDLAARTHTRQVFVATPQDNQRRNPLPVGMWTPRRVRDF